jgi:Mn2+/Fe2+ NRAMP family transporter
LTIALMFALLINASILILAASTFHKTGQTDVAELGRSTIPGAAARLGDGANAVRHRAARLRPTPQ